MMNIVIITVAILLGGYLAFSRRLSGSSSWQKDLTHKTFREEKVRMKNWQTILTTGLLVFATSGVADKKMSNNVQLFMA